MVEWWGSGKWGFGNGNGGFLGFLKILDDEKDFYEACFCLGFDVDG